MQSSQEICTKTCQNIHCLTYTALTASGNWYDVLTQIHILWWIIMILITAFCCLVTVLLCYMRIQHNVAKKLLEAHRVSAAVRSVSQSSIHLGHNIDPATRVRKLKSFSREQSQSQTTQIKLRSPSTPVQMADSPDPYSDLVVRPNSLPAQQGGSLFMAEERTAQFSQRSKSIPVGLHGKFGRSGGAFDDKEEGYHVQYHSGSMQGNPMVYHSHAKTLAFKPRNDTVLNMVEENTSTNSPVSPQYEIEDSQETEVLSMDTSSNGSNNKQRKIAVNTRSNSPWKMKGNASETELVQLHHQQQHNKYNQPGAMPINRFYPQKSDNSMSSGAAQIVYQQSPKIQPFTQQQSYNQSRSGAPTMYTMSPQQSYGSNHSGNQPGGLYNNVSQPQARQHPAVPHQIQTHNNNQQQHIMYGQYSQQQSVPTPPPNMSNDNVIRGTPDTTYSNQSAQYNQQHPYQQHPGSIPGPPPQQMDKYPVMLPNMSVPQYQQGMALRPIESQKAEFEAPPTIPTIPQSQYEPPPNSIQSTEYAAREPSQSNISSAVTATTTVIYHDKEEKASQMDSVSQRRMTQGNDDEKVNEKINENVLTLPAHSVQTREHSPSVERRNKNLENALQYLAKNAQNLNVAHHQEESSAAWTETNMSQIRLGQSVRTIGLDDEPSTGLNEMLGGMFAINSGKEHDEQLQEESEWQSDTDKQEMMTEMTEITEDDNTVYENYPR